MNTGLSMMSKNVTEDHSTIVLRSPKWEKAQIKKWHRGYAAVVPLNYEGNYSITSSTSPYSFNPEAVSFLMINKSEDGSMQGEIVYIIRDKLVVPSDLGEQHCFTGTILIEDLHGEFLVAHVYNPGRGVLSYGNPNTTISSKPIDSKGIDCYIYEWWQKTSIDGRQTWSEPVLLSSRVVCRYYVDFSIEAAYNDAYFDLGGGADAGETEDEDGGYYFPQAPRPLDSREIEMLNLARNDLTKDCATNKIINTVWGGIIFNVDGSITTPAQYNVATNTISFRNSDAINANNILEELFHAYQNTVYPGGIGQYSRYRPGNTNIEFEAKLFKDIYCYTKQQVNDQVIPCGTSATNGFPGPVVNLYMNWVIDIAFQGFTPALMEQYKTMLGYFNQYNVEYGGYLVTSLNTPLAIIQSKLGCN